MFSAIDYGHLGELTNTGDETGARISYDGREAAQRQRDFLA